MATFSLALLSNVELYSVVYLIPLILLLHRKRRDKTLKECIAVSIIFFITWTVVLQILGLFLVGGTNYLQSLEQSYVMFYSHLEDHQMNLGLNWYLFIHLFHRFRRSFVVMIAGSSVMLIGPLTCRLHQYPIVLLALFFGNYVLLKPNPVVHDVPMLLSLMILSPRSVIRLTYITIISLVALPVPLGLYLLDHWLWIEPGSGNANYVFFQSMAYNIFLQFIIGEFMVRTIQRYKALSLTEKNEFLRLKSSL